MAPMQKCSRLALGRSQTARRWIPVRAPVIASEIVNAMAASRSMFFKSNLSRLSQRTDQAVEAAAADYDPQQGRDLHSIFSAGKL